MGAVAAKGRVQGNRYWNKGSSNCLARCGEKQGTAGVYGHCWCLRCQVDWTVLHKHELAAQLAQKILTRTYAMFKNLLLSQTGKISS